jgi:beta-lactamase regulating signal transducer with metallopeptidase domain
MEGLLAIGLWNAAGACVLALAVTCVGRFCRRPALMHALWLLVFVKLLTPPLWPVPVLPASPQEVASDWAEPSSAIITPTPTWPENAIEPPALIDDSAPGFRWPWLATALAVWAGGTLFCWGLSVVRVLRFRKLLRQLVPAPTELQEQGLDIAGRFGLRRGPLVYLVSAAISPMIWALSRPARLLVPGGLWGNLNLPGRNLLLAHELAHLRRGDHWVRMLEMLVAGLYWWNPVVWWARHRLRDAAEQCCDAWVVAVFPESAADYAATLVESAAFLSRHGAAVPAGANGLGPVPLLRRRVTMVMNDKTSPRMSWIGLAALMAVAMVVLPLWPTAAESRLAAPVQEIPKPTETPPQTLNEQAIKELNTAKFYLRTGHPGSAAFYYEIIKRRYPGTPAAEEADLALRELRASRQTKSETEPAQPPGKGGQSKTDAMLIEQLEMEAQMTREKVKKAQLELIRAKADFQDLATQDEQGAAEAHAIIWSHNVRLAVLHMHLREVEGRLQEARRQKTAPPPDRAKLLLKALGKFEPKEFDFGVVKSGSPLSHQFHFTNTFQEVLTLDVVGANVGNACSAKTDKREVKPGERIAITVQIDTTGLKGVWAGSVHLKINNGEAYVDLPLRVQISDEPVGEMYLRGQFERTRGFEIKSDNQQPEANGLARKAHDSQQPPASSDVVVSRQRKVVLPVVIEEQALPRVAEVVLWVSSDEGKTWSIAAKARPADRRLVFTAPADGLYFFQSSPSTMTVVPSRIPES